MKVLVFGFSVTGDPTGYVEQWQADYGPQHPQMVVDKIAFGGLQPQAARHILGEVMASRNPDALVIEIATPATRASEGDPERLADHADTLENFFLHCRRRNIPCGLLDLPLLGVTPEADWMARLHAAHATRFGVPRVSVDYQDGTLKDVVHPNDKGKAIYAVALEELLGRILASSPDYSQLKPRREFGSFAVPELKVTGGRLRDFARAGFEAKTLSFTPNEPVSLELPRKVLVTGFFTLMGPRSGTIEVSLPNFKKEILCYDRHSYYERVQGMRLRPTETAQMSLRQTVAIPDVELVKGDRNTESRIGTLTHVLYDIPLPGR